MGTIELRTHIHRIVDGIEDEKLLKTIYDFLKIRETSEAGRLWETLTEEQKREVLLAYDESEDENNLIDKEKIFKKKK